MIYVFDAIYHALNPINYILCMSVMHISIVIFIIVGRVRNMGMLDVIWYLNVINKAERLVNKQNNQS